MDTTTLVMAVVAAALVVMYLLKRGARVSREDGD
jgi:hypothetical protein